MVIARFPDRLAKVAARSERGQGRRSAGQLAAEATRERRKALTMQLLESGLGYRRIAEELTRQGMPCSSATVYYDVQEQLGALDEARRKTGERILDKYLARVENLALHMTDGMQRGDRQAAAVLLRTLEFGARLERAGEKDAAGEGVGPRPYAALDDAALDAQIREALLTLRDTQLELTARTAVDGEVAAAAPALPPAGGDGTDS